MYKNGDQGHNQNSGKAQGRNQSQSGPWLRVAACTCVLPGLIGVSSWVSGSLSELWTRQALLSFTHFWKISRMARAHRCGSLSALLWGLLLCYYIIVWKQFLGNHFLFSFTIQIRALRYHTMLRVSMKVTQLGESSSRADSQFPAISTVPHLCWPWSTACINRQADV